MEVSPTLPQMEGEYAQGEMPVRPRSDGPSNVVQTSLPPNMPGASADTPQKPKLIPRGSHATEKKLPNTAKVAIPRQRSGNAPRYSRRVPLACESCRTRKTKCSGDTPVCRQCKELGVTCRFPVSWRDRTKGEITHLSIKATEYENILKDIGAFVDGRTAERIRATLDKYAPGSENTSSEPLSNSVTPQDDNDDLDVETAPSSIGSLEAIDRVEEDVNRDPPSRATGYMGKNSEVTWIQRLRKEAVQRAQKRPGTYEPPDEAEFAFHTVNYHLDDMDISVPGPVHLYKMPPRQLADKLFEDYLETVHPFFPIISRVLFRNQYTTFYDTAVRPGNKWLAILNLIFAIAAKHAHLSQAPWRGEPDDHLVYLTRARILSMNGDTLFSHPDLQQVQVEGLIAYYLLASDQINRSWRIAALAVRSATTLGLNMKNTSEGTAAVSKEARYRVWWCVYTFEHMIGIMTGRVTCITDGICTTPMPLPYDEEQLLEPTPAKLLDDHALRADLIESALASIYVRHMPLNPVGGVKARHTDKLRDTSWLKSQPLTDALAFLYYADLAVVAQEIVNRVYSLDCAIVPWVHIENRIGELRSRIDLWHSNLPEKLDFTRRDDRIQDVLRSKLFLAFHYYSARITLGRPCLCRRDARQNHPSEKPTFSHSMAVNALESAHAMLDLIPDEPDAIQLYQKCPWWCVLHYLMQAVTVLLLELSFGCIHMPEKELEILASSKKGVRWLFAMSKCSLASLRAWELCDSNLRRIAYGMNYDINDLPTYDFASKLNQPGTTETMDAAPPSSQPGEMPSPFLFDLVQAQQQQQQPPPPPQQPTTVPQVPAATATTAAQPQPQLPQDGYPFPQVPTTMTSNAPMMPTNMPISPGDQYFPYDPIGGEFMRSFFPSGLEEEPWNNMNAETGDAGDLMNMN